jgi:hypothetical protein
MIYLLVSVAIAISVYFGIRFERISWINTQIGMDGVSRYRHLSNGRVFKVTEIDQPLA